MCLSSKENRSSGLVYDEDGDVVDKETAAAFCGEDGKGDDDDE